MPGFGSHRWMRAGAAARSAQRPQRLPGRACGRRRCWSRRVRCDGVDEILYLANSSAACPHHMGGAGFGRHVGHAENSLAAYRGHGGGHDDRPPLAFFFMCGTAALIVPNIDVRFVSMTRSQRSSRTCRTPRWSFVLRSCRGSLAVNRCGHSRTPRPACHSGRPPHRCRRAGQAIGDIEGLPADVATPSATAARRLQSEDASRSIKVTRAPLSAMTSA